jgi:hypothetical protein
MRRPGASINCHWAEICVPILLNPLTRQGNVGFLLVPDVLFADRFYGITGQAIMTVDMNTAGGGGCQAPRTSDALQSNFNF